MAEKTYTIRSKAHNAPIKTGTLDFILEQYFSKFYNPNKFEIIDNSTLEAIDPNNVEKTTSFYEEEPEEEILDVTDLKWPYDVDSESNGNTD